MAVFRKEPEGTPVQALLFTAPRPLTAAAVRVKIDDKSEALKFKQRRSSAVAAWQAEAWEYYDAISEIKYAFNLVASVVSRIRLYAAVIEDPAEQPVPIRNAQSMDPDLADAAERGLARLDSAYGGQAGLLRDAALNLSVAGECYLVQIPATYDKPESWDIRSVDELQVDNKGLYSIAPRRDLQGQQPGKPGIITLPDDAFMGRIWRAHPRFSEDPDSSLIGLLDLCAELLLLNRAFRATERSRLNAGALYLPDGLSVAANPDPGFGIIEGADEEDYETQAEEAADEFEENLIDAMVTPIEDESSAAAVVPLIIRGPAELGDKIKQFKFERSFDGALERRADRVLDRILQGLDVPKDTVTGLANVKYSNAVQIDEALYKAHIEPMLLLIADAITVIFLRPHLVANGWSEADAQRVVVWYDPSAVATRNDRASDADSGYDKLAISADTWRRAHGFSDTDAPNPTELALRLLQEKISLTPELSEALLTAVAPEIMQAARATTQANSVAPVPGNVQQILSGQPADPNAAPGDTGQPAPEPGAQEPVDPQGAPVTPAPPTGADLPADQAGPGIEPGADAPPFPLAEPVE